MKIKRSILKREYEQFCDAWKNEKIYHRLTKENGKELPEGQGELGRKPTFAMWLNAKKNGVFTKHIDDKFKEKTVEVSDAVWEE